LLIEGVESSGAIKKRRLSQVMKNIIIASHKYALVISYWPWFDLLCLAAKDTVIWWLDTNRKTIQLCKSIIW